MNPQLQNLYNQQDAISQQNALAQGYSWDHGPASQQNAGPYLGYAAQDTYTTDRIANVESVLYIGNTAGLTTGTMLNITGTAATTGTAFTFGTSYYYMDPQDYAKREKFKELGKLLEYNALKRLKQ